MKKISTPLVALLLSLFLVAGCSTSTAIKTESVPVKIAISKAVPADVYQNYFRWIGYADSTAIHYDMYHLDYDSALSLLETCDGLLLTGGTDIYPGRYGKEFDTVRCWAADFKRDTMEFNLFRAALEKGIPIMGICRGLQLINVAMGGTLYIDIPQDLDTLVNHRIAETYDANHMVSIQDSSLLLEITGAEQGTVNSAHHQGIEVPGEMLRIIANTDDGLPESIQLADPGNQFLLGVQWHPERLDYANPLSGPLAIRFIEEAHKYKNKKINEK